MSQLYIFPWFDIGEPRAYGPYQLVPYERGKQPAGEGSDLQAELDAVLSPFHAVEARPVDGCTLLQFEGHELTEELPTEYDGSECRGYCLLVGTASPSRPTTETGSLMANTSSRGVKVSLQTEDDPGVTKRLR